MMHRPVLVIVRVLLNFGWFNRLWIGFEIGPAGLLHMKHLSSPFRIAPVLKLDVHRLAHRPQRELATTSHVPSDVFDTNMCKGLGRVVEVRPGKRWITLKRWTSARMEGIRHDGERHIWERERAHWAWDQSTECKGDCLRV